MLITSGAAKEALQQLETLDGLADEDPDVMLYWVSANALLGRMDDACDRANTMIERKPGMRTLLGLAYAFREACMYDEASRYFTQITDQGHCPDALLGLAGVAYERRDYQATRVLLLSALDITRERLPGSIHPLGMLQEVCQELSSVAEPVAGCSAWVCRFPVDDEGGTKWILSLLTYARSSEEAKEIASEIHAAIYPDGTSQGVTAQCERANEDQQPSGNVAPGIYGHWYDESEETENGKAA